MRQRHLLILLATAALAIAAACGGDATKPTGPVSTEERAASPFSRVTVDGDLDLTVRLKGGAPERIEVSAPGGGHERVVTELADGAITISADGDPFEGTSVLLVVPMLDAVTADDGAAVSIVGEVNLPLFEAIASSGSSIVAEEVTGFTNSGGTWELTAEEGSTIDLDALVVSAVTVAATGRSTIAVEALTSVLGTVEAGATLEVAGRPGRVDVSGGGFVRAEPAESTATSGGTLVARPDELTGAPLPALETASVAFDEDRFNASAGNFPALTDPEVVSASEARWLEDGTLVLGATQNGEARAYPIFQLQFHHVANDTLGGDPYLVTF